MKYSKESRKNKYPVVDRLPVSAMTISDFADKEKSTIPYIYKLQSKGKLEEVKNVKIVIFKGINFVIPA